MPIFKIGIFVLIQGDGYTGDFYVYPAKLKPVRLKRRSPEHETMLMTIAEQLEQKGLERGIEQGREEGKVETAQALLRHGVSLDIIVTSTGLSRDKIEALKH
ncbi:Rpn family recombination-promoting nuclease/putative transposase [Photorhabdus sp. RM71S]|uniref:Rpn family recombination-promoting nuclease/putative transposase n=1 Tax=Photorhabdus sp. RM71S TaxID=3342824 RepID=UPI0036DA6CCA